MVARKQKPTIVFHAIVQLSFPNELIIITGYVTRSTDKPVSPPLNKR